MNRNQQKFITVVEIIVDVLVILGAYWLSYWIQFDLFNNGNALRITEYRWPVKYVIVGIVIINCFMNLYRPMNVTGRLKEAKQIAATGIIVLVLFWAILFLGSTSKVFPWTVLFSRRMVFRFCVLYVIFSVLWRNLYRIFILRMRQSRFNRKKVLVIGYGRAAEGYMDRILTHLQWGFDLVGILDDKKETGYEYHGVRVLGSTSLLESILSENRVEEIVIALHLSEYGKLEEIVKTCEKSGVHTVFIPDYNNIIPTKPYTEDLMGLPMIHIRHVPLMDGVNMMVKRIFDIVGSLAGIVIFSPIMIVTAIAVKATSPGEIIFCQERVGLHNHPFRMYKFRSMAVQTREEEKDKWTTKGDARITGVGKFIRKTSIDELPQLFNVLKGDMSLVGPRPERPYFVEKFKEEIPRYMVKHQVRPGMTGWAQVNGLRGDTSIRKRIEFDLYYIENWSLLFDIRILFLTVFRGFVNKNAY